MRALSRNLTGYAPPVFPFRVAFGRLARLRRNDWTKILAWYRAIPSVGMKSMKRARD
jgi:hypothetical protein